MFSKKKGGKPGLSMYEAVPRPLVTHEIINENKVVLLKPKFGNSWLRKHLIPKMKHPYFRITLDELGSCFWQKMDGKRNAMQIAELMEAELGEKIHPTHERLGIFLRMLKNGKFIEL